MNDKLPFPPGPGNRPPLSDLQALRDGPHAFLLQVARNYGPIVRYPVGPLAVYLVTGPEGVKHVLQDNHKNYCKDTFQYNLLSSITGKGLLTSDGELWLRQRRLAAPAFHKQRVAGFSPMIVEAAQRMLLRWEERAAGSEPVDVAAEMMQVALQIVGKAMFSAEIGDQADELATATLTVLDHIVGRARTFGAVPEWLPTRGNRAHKRAMRVLDGAVYGTIGARRGPHPSTPLRSAQDAIDASGQPTTKHPEPTTKHPERSTFPQEGAESKDAALDDLLAILMRSVDEQTGEGMSDQQLRDESMTVLIAGHETVASALAWTWDLLGRNPAAEARLHEELDRELGGRAPAADDLPRLKYTEMVFQEAMRLYPPAWIISRKAEDDDEIGGYLVPKGALVVTSPYVTQRMPDLWPEPEAFRPERFSPQEATGRHRYAYYPFGGGPRLCIGNGFAMTEAALIIATVAQRFTLRSVSGTPVAVEPGVTLRPKHGLAMALQAR
jgi:cytochrome P450